jgi:uncharacterized protein
MLVSALHIYPVKSCGGLSLSEGRIGRMGLERDRQWMFVDDSGMFVAQRNGDSGLGAAVSTMCLIRTGFDGDMLQLTAPEMPPLRVPIAGSDGPRRSVRVWNSHTEGADQGEAAAEWATSYLGRERPGRYRLVRMPDAGIRTAKIGTSELAYGDAYPFLIISEESLADLNARLASPLPMDRFRPNIVLRGCKPYEEDRLDRVRIGGVAFQGMTLCVRCPITTTNQQTGERGKEPLRTLATYRRSPGGVIFGRNFNHAGEGIVRIGDAVTLG